MPETERQEIYCYIFLSEADRAYGQACLELSERLLTRQEIGACDAVMVKEAADLEKVLERAVQQGYLLFVLAPNHPFAVLQFLTPGRVKELLR